MQTTITYDKGLLANLLTNRQYAEALQYIDSLNIKKNLDLSREDIARLYFAQGQCFYRLGDYHKAAVKVKCSIKIADPLNDNLLYARQKYTLGQIYFEIGRLDEALEEFSEASAFFHRVNDTPRLLAAQEMFALIHFHKGNLLSAIELNEATLLRVKGLGLIEHVKVVAFNLCRILLWTGDYARIRELLDSVADDCIDPLNQTWLESLRGTLYVRLLDSSTAKKHLEKALTIARANCYRRDEVVCMEYLGLNEYYSGNYAKAKEYYEQILAMPELTASAVAQTLRLLTDVQVALDELDQAAETAGKAEEAITKIKEWVELGTLHRVLALLADKRGDLAGTIANIDKAIAILARHGARYELAVTYLAMGQTRCLDNDLRKERLQQAKTLFVDMNVPKRVAQVEKAMMGLRENAVARKRRTDSYRTIGLPTIIGQSEPIKNLLSRANKFAEKDGNILITGETGTGKDLLAQYVHAMSPRGSRPFVVVNSASIPESLLEAELFGVCKGSYTGAEKDRVGLIAQAEGGSFFFDEISETPLSLQAKLLRVIETKEVRRVGENRDRRYDVRFIAATNCDLEERVQTGLFREDLFYRLRRGHLHVPPLRERNGDLPLLVHHFLFKSGFGNYTLEQVTFLVEVTGCDQHDWPGNVRELEGMIDDAATVCSSKLVMDLVPIIKSILIRHSKNDPQYPERAELIAALERNSGNQTKAANDLGIAASTFRDRLKKNGII